MEVDLYQRRRGMYGLGVVDPMTGIDTSAGLTLPTTTPVVDLTAPAPASTSFLSSITSGIDLTSMFSYDALDSGCFWAMGALFGVQRRQAGLRESRTPNQ